MKTTEDTPPAAAVTDLEAVLRQVDAGGVSDPVLLQRIEERSAAIRERLLQERGILDVAAALVREIRDE